MTINRYKIPTLLLIAFIIAQFSAPNQAAQADEYDWSKLDRVGTYKVGNEGHIGHHLWRDYSQADAIQLLDELPTRLQSPSYREMAKRLLLSESSPRKEDIQAPSFLFKRIEKLTSYGLFEEAKSLYDLAKQDEESQPQTYEMALGRLLTELPNQSLASICLDVQAASSIFRDMPAWRELHHFCQLRFGGAAKIQMDTMSFDNFPELKMALTADYIAMRALKTPIGTLIAFQDQKISASDFNNAAKTIDDLTDLTVFLALDKNFAGNTAYQCYAIEAADRGLIPLSRLQDIYLGASFSETDLNHEGGEITMHPCHVPAYFYQRLVNADTPEDKQTLFDHAMNVTRSVPIQALVPLYLAAKDAEFKQSWRAGLLAVLNDEKIIVDEKSDLYPLVRIGQFESWDEKSYKNWIERNENAQKDVFVNRDPALLLYLSQILSSDFDNLRRISTNIKYGNFFSLTYTKKSLGLGLGFTDFFAESYKTGDDAKFIVTLLGVIGTHDVQNINPYDLPVILLGFKAYKLDKEAIALALEYLQ